MKKTKIYIISIALLFLFDAIQAQVHYQNTTTNNTNSSAIGYGTIASGEKSFASGLTSTASGVGSTTMGINNLAIGHYSITLGSDLKAAQGHSIVIGSGFANSFRLVNNQTYSLMIGFMSQYPTLFVGTSPAYNKTGSVAIGNVVNDQGYMDPQAKLHIRADEGEEAAVFIEPHNFSNGEAANIYLGNKHNGISADTNNGLIYTSQKNHIFRGGDIYIEDIDKGIIMKSPDGRCWRGTLDNNGSLHFTVMETCQGETVFVPENEAQGTNNGLKVYPNPTRNYLTVEFKNRANNQVIVKLLDERGAEIKTSKITGTKTHIYTGDIPSGTYIVQVIAGNKVLAKKIIRK